MREVIGQLRKENNKTQDEVASAIGVVRSTVSFWENGKLIPSKINLSKLEKYFNVPEGTIGNAIGNETLVTSVTQSVKNEKIEVKIEMSQELQEIVENYTKITDQLLNKLAVADLGQLEKINQLNLAVGKRLNMLMQLKKEEGESIESLWKSLSK